MRTRPTVLAISLVLVGWLAGCASEPSDTADTTDASEPTTPTTVPIRADVQTILSNWVEAEEVIGAVAAVGRSGQDPSIAAAGWSNQESTATSSSAEAYRIGSITKLFTAALVLDLVEDGVIGLEDPVGDYVADPPANLTIEHLLSHTSGLPDLDVAENIMPAIMDPTTVETPDEVIDKALDGGLSHQPGIQQSYSSTNYLILGVVVEAATGQSYDSALHDNVLEPLGLDNTGFEGPDTKLATPYERPGPGQPQFPLDEFATDVAVRASWSAGGLVSTAEDLVVFTEALFGGDLLSSESLDLMLDTSSGPRAGYGLGVSQYPMRDGVVYGHNGRTIGFASSLRHDPSTGITVIVLSNDGTAPTGDLASELLLTEGRG